MKIPHLNSERILLRPIEPEDLETFYAIENDVDTWGSSNTTVPYSKYVLKQYIESSQADLFTDKEVKLIIETVQDKKTIGIIDLFNFSPLDQRAELGIIILGAYRKQGYAVEAIQVLEEYAFGFLMLHQLHALVDSENKASVRLFEKCSFSKSSILKDWFYGIEGHRDAYVYQRINT